MSSSGGTIETSSNIFNNATSKDFIFRTSTLSEKMIIGNTPCNLDNAALYIKQNSIGVRKVPDINNILEVPGLVVDSSSNVTVANTLNVNNISLTGNVIPVTDVISDLGDSSHRFRDLYLSGNTIHLGDTAISKSDTGDIKFVDPATSNLRNVVMNSVNIGGTTISQSNGQLMLGSVSTGTLERFVNLSNNNYTGFGTSNPLGSIHVDNRTSTPQMKLIFTHALHTTPLTSSSGYQFWLDAAGHGYVQNFLTGKNVSISTKDTGQIFLGSNISTGRVNIWSSNDSQLAIKTYNPSRTAGILLDATQGTFNSTSNNIGGRSFYVRSAGGSATGTTAGDRAGTLEIGDSGGNAIDSAARNNLVVLDRFSRLWVGRDIILGKMGVTYVGSNSSLDTQPAIVVVGDSNSSGLKMPLLHLGRNSKTPDTSGFGLQLVDSSGTNSFRVGRGDITNNSGNPTYSSDLVISSAGYVGIGTSTPNAMLHINGSTFMPTGGSLWIGYYGDSNARTRIHNNGQNTYIDYWSNLYFRAGPGTPLGYVTFSSNGLVGIGSTTPTQKLDVVGNIKASGTLTCANITGADATLSNVSLGNTGILATPNVIGVSNMLNIGCDTNTTTVNIACSSVSQTVNIGTTGSSNSVINIGGPGDTVNIIGVTNNVATNNTTSCNKTIDLNYGGASGTGGASGIHIIEDSSIAGYIKTSPDRTSFLFKAPAVPEAKIDLTGGNIGLGSLTINTNSNIGIGTTSPVYKLDVSGTINATTYCNLQWSMLKGVPTLATFSNDLSNFSLNTTFSSNVTANTVSVCNLTVSTSATFTDTTITNITTSNIVASNITVTSLYTSNIATPVFGDVMTMGCDSNTTRIDIGAGSTTLLNIGTNNAGTVINIGGISDTVQIPGTLIATVADTLPQADGTYTYTDIDLGNPDVKNTDPDKLVATALVIGTGVSPLGTTSVINEKFRIGQYVDAKKTLTLNRDSAANSGCNVGINIEENGVINGWMETTSDRSGFWFKSPGANQVYTMSMGANYVSFNSNTMIMVGDSNGYIGIGTNNPSASYKLTVAGTLFANAYANLPTSSISGVAGIVALCNVVNSTSTNVASTAAAVKSVYDTAIGISNVMASKWTPVNATSTTLGIVNLCDAVNSNLGAVNNATLAATPKAVYDTYQLASSKWTATNATASTQGYVYITDSTACNVAAATTPIAASARSVFNTMQTALGKWTPVNASQTVPGYVYVSDATLCNRSWSNTDILYPGPIVASVKAVNDVMVKTVATSNMAYSNLKASPTTYGHVYLTDSTACNTLTASGSVAFAATPAAVNTVFNLATSASNIAASKWTQVPANATQQGTVFLMDAVNSNLLATNTIPFAATPAAVSTVNTLATTTSNQAFACWKPVNATTSVRGYVYLTDATTCNITSASGVPVVPTASALSNTWYVAVTASNQAFSNQPIGTASVSGLLKLSDSISDAVSGINSGIAATPKAVQQAYSLASGKFTDRPGQAAQRGTVFLTDSTSCNVSQSTQAIAASAMAVYNAYQMGVLASNLAMTRPTTLASGTLTTAGALQLCDDPTSTSTTLAATINSVKQVKDMISTTLLTTGGTLTGDLTGTNAKFSGSVWSGHGGNFVQLNSNSTIVSKNTTALSIGFAADTALTSWSEKMRIATDGKVGIGTNNPSALLDIFGGAATIRNTTGTTATATLSLNNSGKKIDFNTNSTIGQNSLVSSGDQSIIFTNGTVGTGALTIGPWISQNKGIKINSVGVGINGAPHSTYDLRVAGNAIIDVGWLRTTGATGIYNETYGGGWYMTDANWLRSFADKSIITGGWISSGRLGIATYNPTEALHIASGNLLMDNGYLKFPQSANCGIQFGNSSSKIYDDANLNIYTDDFMYFNNSGGNAITINNSRYVGIGTSSPGRPLQVNSSFSANGMFGLKQTTTGNECSMSFDNGSTSIVMGLNCYNAGASVFNIGNTINLNAGKVGVGISTPLSPLHVLNTTSLGSNAGDIAPIAHFQANNTNASYLRVFGRRHTTTSNSTWSSASTRIQQTIDVTDMSYIEFNPSDGTNSTTDLAFGCGNSETVRVTAGGNVGIGTITPAYKLDVNGNARIQNVLYTNNQANNCVISLYKSGGNPATTDTNYYGFGINASLLRYSTDQYGDHGFFSDTTELMRIKSSGNVGIGSTSPSAKLDVAGNIKTSGELISTSANALRMVYGQYGTFFRNDGTNTWFLITNQNDQYGNFNSLRPLTINNATGRVTVGNGLTVNSACGISTNTPVQFGLNTVGKEVNAGKIGYNLFSTSLDVIGAGNDAVSRAVRIYDRLGIGTNPSYNLDVNGSCRVSGSTYLASTYMGDNTLYLRNDIYHGITYTNTIDGPRVFGWNGGMLGTANGANAMIWNSSGMVGVGGSPQYRLHVYSDNTQWSKPLYISPSTHATSRRASVTIDNWELLQDTGGNGTKDFGIYDTVNSAYRMYISSTGNVAIGANSSSYKLHVNGDINVTGVFRINGTQFTGGSGSAGWSINGSALYSDCNVGLGVVPAYKLDVNGDIHTAGQLRLDGNQGIRWGTDTSRIYESANALNVGASNPVLLRTAGLERMRVDASGNIGIGTSTPICKLDVNGTANFNFRTGVWITSEDTKNRFYFLNNGRSFYGSADGYEWRSSTDSNITALDNSGAFATAGYIASGRNGNFVQLWNDSRIICKNTAPLKFGFASDLNAGSWSERMRIDTSGNIGIGTTTPSTRLHIQGGDALITGATWNATGNQAKLMLGDSNQSIMGVHGTGIVIEPYGTTSPFVVRQITGNVGIGITNPAFKLDVYGTANFNFKTNNWINSEDGKNRMFYSANSRSFFGSPDGFEWRNSADANIAVLDNGGTLSASGHVCSGKGGNFVQLWSDSAIICKNTADLRFGFANDLSAGLWSEKMRLQTDGYLKLFSRLGVGNSLVGISSSLTVFGDDNNRIAYFYNDQNSCFIRIARSDRASKWWDIGVDGNGNFAVGNEAWVGVYLPYSQKSWSQLSDRRTKKDIQQITNGLYIVDNLKPVRYHMNNDAEDSELRLGLIAQEVEPFIPEVIDKYNTEEFPNGVLSVRYTDIIPVLIAAIKDLKKEHQTQIDALTARLDAQEKLIQQLLAAVSP
jgi:hypothetical protein